MLRGRPELLHLVNGVGETALHFLAVENDATGVSWLHARGADLNTKTRLGTPVLFEVACLAYKDLFNWFLAQGADVHATDEDDHDMIESGITRLCSRWPSAADEPHKTSPCPCPLPL